MVFFFRSIHCLNLPRFHISYLFLKFLGREIVKNWHDTFYAAHFGISHS